MRPKLNLAVGGTVCGKNTQNQMKRSHHFIHNRLNRPALLHFLHRSPYPLSASVGMWMWVSKWVSGWVRKEETHSSLKKVRQVRRSWSSFMSKAELKQRKSLNVGKSPGMVDGWCKSTLSDITDSKVCSESTLANCLRALCSCTVMK